MRTCILLLLLIMSQFSKAQLVSLQGTIEEKNGDMLASATVLLLQAHDSTILNYTVTDDQGSFTLQKVPKGKYVLKISYLGYLPYTRSLEIKGTHKSLDMGKIQLLPMTYELDAITVKDERAVYIKNDTVEYNTEFFSTQANANVEALLQKLPGVIIKADGSISAHGENVARIYVDGKEFFGGDLEMATKNLPADAVASIQVLDEQNEAAKFSGIADADPKKVINLKLKKDWKNMGFGEAKAAVGTEDRYAGKINYNKFDEKNQFSFLGMSNNVNNLNVSGENTGALSRQNGLSTNHKAGLNLSKQSSSNTLLKGNYLYNNNLIRSSESLSRQNFLPEGAAMYSENSSQENNNNFHTLTIGIENEDEQQVLKVNNTFNYSETNMLSESSRMSYDADSSLVNEGDRSSDILNSSYNLRTDLFFGRRFRREGRAVNVSGNLYIAKKNLDAQSISDIRYAEDAQELINQQNYQTNTDASFDVSISYTEPITKKQLVQMEYNISNQLSITDFDIIDISEEQNSLDDNVSNFFHASYIYQRLGLDYQVNFESIRFGMGVSAQQAQLDRRAEIQLDQLSQSFQYVLPKMSAKIKFNRLSSLDLKYTTSVREPDVNQLQPMLARFDPLHLYVGNPDLQPEYNHQGRMLYNNFMPSTGIYLSANISYTYTENPILPAISINERQIRTTQYINAEERSSMLYYLSAGIPINLLSSQFNISPYYREGITNNMLNGIQGNILQKVVGGNLSYSINLHDIILANFRADISNTSSDYDLNDSRDQQFLTASYITDATIYLLEDFYLAAEFDFKKYQNEQLDFHQTVPLLNFSISKHLFEKDNAEIKLSAFNVLNQNMGASQLANSNYIEQSRQQSLGSVYMLSLAYYLRQHP